MNLQQKKGLLESIIGQFETVAVAFSGGVDSTYLLAMCYDVLGPERVLAVTASSPGMPRSELQEAERLARLIGARWEVISTREMENPNYVRNDANRCFYCKQELFTAMQAIVQRHRLSAIVYGANMDDVSDHRPGMLAARQYGVLAPLLKARMGKVDIRVLAKERGLPNHARPSMACLASRIPYGSAITVEALAQVEEGEAFLKREIGLQQVRVRHHGNVARLEVESSELSRLVQRDIRERVIARMQDLGFTYVALDLAGFRSGSMNAALLQESENGRMQHNIMKDSPDSEINGTSR